MILSRYNDKRKKSATSHCGGCSVKWTNTCTRLTPIIIPSRNVALPPQNNKATDDCSAAMTAKRHARTGPTFGAYLFNEKTAADFTSWR